MLPRIIIIIIISWKAPGPDGINNFWITRFTATHSYLAHHFNQFIEDAGNISDFLVQGITYLLPKSQDCQDPSKYRSITCLCTIYKICTVCIAGKIYKHLDTNKLLAEEHKRCIKNSQGCKEQLITGSVVLEQAHEDGMRRSEEVQCREWGGGGWRRVFMERVYRVVSDEKWRTGVKAWVN